MKEELMEMKSKKVNCKIVVIGLKGLSVQITEPITSISNF